MEIQLKKGIINIPLHPLTMASLWRTIKLQLDRHIKLTTTTTLLFTFPLQSFKTY